MKNKLRSIVSCIFLFLCALLALSCSNSAPEAAVDDETPTLRYTADGLYQATVWTEEVEVDRLTAKVSQVPGVSSRLNLTPLILLAEKAADSDPIFPVLDSFGSLDTTLISSSLREMLTSFSEAISKNSDADSFMARDCLYSLALFYSDFTRIFATCFDFSQAEPEDDESDGAEIKEKRYFTSFVFAQPFIDGVSYEVPVKFFSDKATLTLSVFCFEQSGAWKIDQVQIADWEIFDGKK